MSNAPRLFVIAGINDVDQMLLEDRMRRLSKAQLLELYVHLYIHTHGQSTPGTFILDDINERLVVIESHCKAWGPLGKPPRIRS